MLFVAIFACAGVSVASVFFGAVFCTVVYVARQPVRRRRRR